jgi:thiamine-phosphate pyrophosphorylase
VHLGQEDLAIVEARRRWPGPGKCFGLSTHDEEQALRAREVQPDYIGVGPVFPTPTKARPDPVLGPERAAAIIQAAPMTVVAIGGIDATNLPGLLAFGIQNFAVVRAVCDSLVPREAIRRLQGVWSEHVVEHAHERDLPGSAEKLGS